MSVVFSYVSPINEIVYVDNQEAQMWHILNELEIFRHLSRSFSHQTFCLFLNHLSIRHIFPFVISFPFDDSSALHWTYFYTQISIYKYRINIFIIFCVFIINLCIIYLLKKINENFYILIFTKKKKKFKSLCLRDLG